MMTYSELSDICHVRKISLTELAKSANMTLRGFRDAINNGTISARVVLPICEKLGITPHQFLGWDKRVSATYNTQNSTVVNSQNVGVADIDFLHQQIAEKDKQIEQLLNLLNKGVNNQ